MSTDVKYQPEDIEFILLNKEYHELDQEELKFVNEFISSEEEYLLMRGTLLGITETVQPEIEVVPSYSVKDALMAEFEKEGRGAAAWWNNVMGFLFPTDRSLFRKPGVQMAFVACSLLLVVTIVPWGDVAREKNDLAFQEVEETAEGVIDDLELEGQKPAMIIDSAIGTKEEITSGLDQKLSREVTGDCTLVYKIQLGEMKETMSSTEIRDELNEVAANGADRTTNATGGVSSTDALYFSDEVTTIERDGKLFDKSEDQFSFNGQTSPDFDLALDSVSTGAGAGGTVSPSTSGLFTPQFGTPAKSDFDSTIDGSVISKEESLANEVTIDNAPSDSFIRINKLDENNKGLTKMKNRRERKNMTFSSDNPASVTRYDDLPRTSRSLARDSELIDLFYTAR